MTTRRHILHSGLFAACACLAASAAVAQGSAPTAGKWICPPCGCPSDGKDFEAAGFCPDCAMPLMAKPAQPPTS